MRGVLFSDLLVRIIREVSGQDLAGMEDGSASADQTVVRIPLFVSSARHSQSQTALSQTIVGEETLMCCFERLDFSAGVLEYVFSTGSESWTAKICDEDSSQTVNLEAGKKYSREVHQRFVSASQKRAPGAIEDQPRVAFAFDAGRNNLLVKDLHNKTWYTFCSIPLCRDNGALLRVVDLLSSRLQTTVQKNKDLTDEAEEHGNALKLAISSLKEACFERKKLENDLLAKHAQILNAKKLKIAALTKELESVRSAGSEPSTKKRNAAKRTRDEISDGFWKNTDDEADSDISDADDESHVSSQKNVARGTGATQALHALKMSTSPKARLASTSKPKTVREGKGNGKGKAPSKTTEKSPSSFSDFSSDSDMDDMVF